MIFERLPPHSDLKDELERICRAHRLQAAFIVCAVGSLEKFTLRFAGKKDATSRSGNYEIISATGTLSPDGIHIHLGLSDDNGNTVGGHLMEGCIVRTTAEIGIQIAEGYHFKREIDPQSGYRELKISHSANHKPAE